MRDESCMLCTCAAVLEQYKACRQLAGFVQEGYMVMLQGRASMAAGALLVTAIAGLSS